jgi:hypothetical protein
MMFIIVSPYFTFTSLDNAQLRNRGDVQPIYSDIFAEQAHQLIGRGSVKTTLVSEQS